MASKKKRKNKKPGNRIAMRGGSYSLVITAVVLAILIAVNVLASALPTSLTRLDISSTQLYSVTSSTKVVVNALEKDVTIYWIVQSDHEDDVIENLLSRYAALSSHIQVVKKNPDTYPTFTAQYTEDTVSNNSLIVECGDKSRYIAYEDIYLTDIDYTTYSYVYSFDGEGAITSAIDYVISDELPRIYLLEGHGEEALPEEFSDQIQKENMEIISFSLLNEDAIPEDADCVMIYAPSDDISEEERTILADYASGGGRLLVIAGPTEDGTLEVLTGLLADYGIEAAEGIVIEGDRNYYAFQQPYITLPEVQSSEITDPLIESKYYAVLPIAMGLNTENAVSGVTSLLTTSDSAFSKTAGYELDTYEKEEGDIDGPFSLAVSVVTDGGGEIVWIASSCFLEEMYNAYSSGANLDLTMNALNSLIGEREAMAIRSKSMGYQYLTITDSQASTLKLGMILLIPAFFVVNGISVVTERKKRRDEQV